MNLTYSSMEGVIHFVWGLDELSDAVLLVKLVAEEQRMLGNVVPENIDDFDEVLNATESVCLEITFEFREFAISIIERLIKASDEQNIGESTRLNSFLYTVKMEQSNAVN